MISGHYPASYEHPQNWLVLLVFSLAAVAIRHYFNIRHLPGFRAWPLIPAVLLLVGLIVATAPEPLTVSQEETSTAGLETRDIYRVIESRCTACHAAVPTIQGFTSAPLGIELDSPEKMHQHAEKIYKAVAITRTMPMANLTQMTDTERHLIARWFEKREAESQR
jgi:uncharacterized membrane protein